MTTQERYSRDAKEYLETIGVKSSVDPLGMLVIDLNSLPDRMSVPELFKLIETFKID